MFKGKVRIYKNVDGKEEIIKKEFNNEKDFNNFIIKNPELKNIGKWEPFKGTDRLFDVNNFFEEVRALGNKDFFKEIEEDFEKLMDKSRKMLGK